MAFVLLSCNQQCKEEATTESHKENDSIASQNDTTAHNQAAEVDEHATLFACEMHPEVQGKKDDKCSKCGMKFTEPVSEKSKEK